MVIDTDDNFFNNLNNNSLAARNVIAHEHGHGLGMQHVEPVSFDFLMEPFTSSNPPFDGPQYHDILIAHRGYGDVNERSNNHLGNDDFNLATDLGTVNDGDSISIGDDARDLFVNPNEVDFVSIDDESDTDYFSFTVNEASIAGITLESLGETYNIGPQDGVNNNELPFDTSLRSDLALALFDTDGVTLLAEIDAAGLGGIETLSDINLATAGTYFIRVTGADNLDSIAVDTQFYGLNITVAASAIPEPGAFFVIGCLGAMGLVRRRR